MSYIDYENLVCDLIEDGWSDADAREYIESLKEEE